MSTSNDTSPPGPNFEPAVPLPVIAPSGEEQKAIRERTQPLMSVIPQRPLSGSLEHEAARIRASRDLRAPNKTSRRSGEPFTL